MQTLCSLCLVKSCKALPCICIEKYFQTTYIYHYCLSFHLSLKGLSFPLHRPYHNFVIVIYFSLQATVATEDTTTARGLLMLSPDTATTVMGELVRTHSSIYIITIIVRYGGYRGGYHGHAYGHGKLLISYLKFNPMCFCLCRLRILRLKSSRSSC